MTQFEYILVYLQNDFNQKYKGVKMSQKKYQNQKEWAEARRERAGRTVRRLKNELSKLESNLSNSSIKVIEKVFKVMSNISIIDNTEVVVSRSQTGAHIARDINFFQTRRQRLLEKIADKPTQENVELITKLDEIENEIYRFISEKKKAFEADNTHANKTSAEKGNKEGTKQKSTETEHENDGENFQEPEEF